MTDGAAAPTAARKPRKAIFLFLVGAALFAVAYCQAPLYYSNQNQYFLHGLANAGFGLLGEDWLAKTRDPTPVFSALVTGTVRFLHPWAFYVYYGILLGAYAAAMFSLFFFLAGAALARRRWPVFVALFVAIHSGLLRWCSYGWLGEDYPWFLQAGVAGQYVLGGYLQPSAFGVLLIGAVCLFAHGRLLATGVCTALAATVHPSYLLPAALLTLGFLAALVAEGRSRRALRLGVFTLILVVPVTAHILLVFGPTSAAVFAQAQDILANVRIPHHSRPDRWLDKVAILQIGWIVLAVVLIRRTRLFLVLAVPLALSAVLTVAQVLTDSNTLALLFPWRVSAVLVPIATTIMLTRLIAAPVQAFEGRWIPALALSTVVMLAGFGMWISAARLAFQSGDEELPVLKFVAQTRQPGDIYFVPVTISLKKTYGSLSTDFQPLSAKRKDIRAIPVDLQRFRLTAAAPIFVDFKAIPYKDAEVLEWRDRLYLAKSVQDMLYAGGLAQALAIAVLRDQGVTHLVLPAAAELGWGCERTYDDHFYRVYRIVGAHSVSEG